MNGLPRVGDTFAGYRLDGVLGRGGMSTVFRAENVRLGNIVALKILRSDLAEDNQFRERFVRESRVASSMNHPNIIPIVDAGQEDGNLFLVMRYVSGSDLKSLLTREGRLEPARCVDIIAQVASALDAAHAKGLLHRDVKPANILLESSGVDYRGDHAYLADFGLTKHTGSTSGLTKTGHFVGTIDYMAPEQIEAGVVDGRADVYALGCVTFQCLTGTVPFVRDGDAAVLWAHLRADLPKATSVRPELPESVDEVIFRALQKSPDDRYQSARELCVALRDALDMRPEGPASVTAMVPTAPHESAPASRAAVTALAAAPPLVGGAAPPPSPPTPPRDEPPRSGRRQVSLLAAAGIAAGVLVLVGGGALAGVLLSRDSVADPPTMSSDSGPDMTSGTMGDHNAAGGRLEEIIPGTLLGSCESTERPPTGAMESVTCLPPNRADRLDVTLFEDKHKLMEAYEAKVKASGVPASSGRCSTTSWNAERPWVHAEHEMSTDGQVLCYFKNGNSYVVWTVTGSNVLATAMTDGLDHGDLFRWWAFWHHQLV